MAPLLRVSICAGGRRDAEGAEHGRTAPHERYVGCADDCAMCWVGDRSRNVTLYVPRITLCAQQSCIAGSTSRIASAKSLQLSNCRGGCRSHWHTDTCKTPPPRPDPAGFKALLGLVRCVLKRAEHPDETDYYGELLLLSYLAKQYQQDLVARVAAYRANAKALAAAAQAARAARDAAGAARAENGRKKAAAVLSHAMLARVLQQVCCSPDMLS